MTGPEGHGRRHGRSGPDGCSALCPARPIETVVLRRNPVRSERSPECVRADGFQGDPNDFDDGHGYLFVIKLHPACDLALELAVPGLSQIPSARDVQRDQAAWMRAGSLCNSRLDGGGGSLARTRLWVEIPDLQGRYREIPRNQTLLATSGSRFPSLDAVIATDSLCSGTGNSFRRAGNSL